MPSRISAARSGLRHTIISRSGMDTTGISSSTPSTLRSTRYRRPGLAPASPRLTRPRLSTLASATVSKSSGSYGADWDVIVIVLCLPDGYLPRLTIGGYLYNTPSGILGNTYIVTVPSPPVIMHHGRHGVPGDRHRLFIDAALGR